MRPLSMMYGGPPDPKRRRSLLSGKVSFRAVARIEENRLHLTLEQDNAIVAESTTLGAGAIEREWSRRKVRVVSRTDDAKIFVKVFVDEKFVSESSGEGTLTVEFEA